MPYNLPVSYDVINNYNPAKYPRTYVHKQALFQALFYLFLKKNYWILVL